MPRGSGVIRREGKRGASWAIKYADASGVQCWETLGREPQWNEKRARQELGKRLDRVDRERWRKPQRLTFGDFAETFRSEYLPGRNLKPSTETSYKEMLRLHLEPFFGSMELAAIEPADVDRYISKTKLAPKTIANHLGLLGVMFKVAKRWRLVSSSPLAEVERPRVERSQMNVLTEAEIARLLAAYRELGAVPPEGTQGEWWALTGRLVAVALATGLRRGELLALRWRDVALLESRLTVREAFVRGTFGTPKSASSRRTIDLGPRAVTVLQEQWQASICRTDDSLVFCHPALGTPLDPSQISRVYLRPALKRARIEKRFRAFHDMRHTALTHEAAAGNPSAYVQLKAGHSQGSVTDRYIHAAQVLFPGAAQKGEDRIFAAVAGEDDEGLQDE